MIRERVAHYLDLVGLAGFEQHYPYQLSGGMQQRVGLVRALAIDPKILLMDEPFASLDAQTREILQEELLRIMERLEERKTMVFITHSIDEAILLGDRIAVMTARPGRIKEIIDLPFGRPRDVEAIRADPRYAELRAHIWHELQGRAAGEGGVSVSVQTGTAVGDGAAETALARKAADRAAAAAANPHRRHPARLARRRARALADSRRQGRCLAVHHAKRHRARRGRDDQERRAVALSVAEPRRAGDRAYACGHRSVLRSAFCWRASGCSTSRFGSYITFLYSIPSVALVPLIVLWAGFDVTAKVVILFLFAFFPMAINTHQGVKNVDPKLIEVGRAFRASEWQLWTNIVLPGALPFIVTGLRLAVGRGLIGMVLADLYTAISGIGYLIVRTAATYEVDKMFVPIVTLGLLGVTLTALLRVVELQVAPWTASAARE